MRLALAALLVVGLAGCAPDAGTGTQRVEVDGVITQITASSGGRSYALDVTGQGLLPLDLGELSPPAMATGVVVEVPDSIDVPDDEEGRFGALSDYAGETDQPLVVVEFLP